MLVSTEGLPGPVMVNRFGKPAMASPRYVRGPSRHFSRSASAAPAADVDLEQRAGHGVEAGGEHDGVDLVLLALDPDALLA